MILGDAVSKLETFQQSQHVVVSVNQFVKI